MKYESLNTVENAAESGWKAGFNDFTDFWEGRTRNPYQLGTREYTRWTAYYAVGFNIAQRQGKKNRRIENGKI